MGPKMHENYLKLWLALIALLAIFALFVVVYMLVISGHTLEAIVVGPGGIIAIFKGLFMLLTKLGA